MERVDRAAVVAMLQSFEADAAVMFEEIWEGLVEMDRRIRYAEFALGGLEAEVKGKGKGKDKGKEKGKDDEKGKEKGKKGEGKDKDKSRTGGGPGAGKGLRRVRR